MVLGLLCWALSAPLCAMAAQRSLRIPDLPCVGVVASKAREVIVVGTAHTPCRSAAEVTAVIQSLRPDVVMVELDQERLEQLMEQANRDKELKYGADFAAAISAASSISAPIVLGDVKARDTLASLRSVAAIAEPTRVWRGVCVFLGSVSDGELLQTKQIDIIRSLRDDPAKLLPLLSGIAAFFLTQLIAMMPQVPQVLSTPLDEVWSLMLMAAFFLGNAVVVVLGVRIFDVMLLSRDEALTNSTLRSLEIAGGLRAGALLRRRYTFSTDPAVLSCAPPLPPEKIPFFTLRRPLGRGEVRRLNLFEPRWLSLLDGLASDRNGDAKGSSTSDRRLGATLGCVLAVNRFYMPIPSCVGGSPEGIGGVGITRSDQRVADVVIQPVARRARILRIEESRRPVTGARRLEVWIEGAEPLRIDAESLAPTDGGYLAGAAAECTEGEFLAASRDVLSPEQQHDVRVVSVVGLAHANGIIDRCALAGLRDDKAMPKV